MAPMGGTQRERLAPNAALRFWRWLVIPSVPLSDEADRRARLMLRVLRLMSVALVCVVAGSLSEQRNPIGQVAAVYAPTAAVFVALFVCAKRGYARVAGWVLAWSFWVLVTVTVFYFGGLKASNAVAYCIPVMVAGTVMGRRGALLLALASVAASGAALHAEQTGWMPSSIGPIVPFNAFIAVTATVLLTAVFHDMALGSVRQALDASSAALQRLRAAEVENETRAMQGAALGQLGERALTAKTAAEVLRDAVETVTSLLPAERALLLIAGERHASFRLDADASRADARGWTVNDPAAAGVLRVLEEHACMLESGELAVLERQLGLQPSAAALGVVVPGRLAPHAVLVVLRDQPHAFTALQRQFVATVASMIGSALERETTEGLAQRAQKLEAVGRLAGGVAHDFNNLLTVMVGSAAELRDHLVAGPAATALDDLENATQRAVLLSNQLLALSRRQPRPAQAIDLGALVADLLPMMRRLVGSQVRLIERLERGPGVTVLGDRAGLEQVLLNLLVNAHQAMPGGGDISVGVQGVPDEIVELTVSDTGVGMDEATRAKIFQAFFTTKPDGTGLGLATVADVVERHGGKVAVESMLGKGSTFRLQFRVLGVDKATISMAPLLPAPPSSPKPQPAVAKRILLVDDHELVRQTATRVLHSLGYEVVAKASASEAIETLQVDQRFALLVTDVNMPGLPGTAIVEVLERRGADLPVLFISGFVDPTGNGLASGGRPGRRTHFLAKPFLPDQLAAAVTACLGAR